MKAPLLILLVALGVSVSGGLAPPEKSYKILMLLPVSTRSHRNIFMPLAEALADRGHKVVMLANHPPVSKHPNILEIYHGLQNFRNEDLNMFETRSKLAGSFQLFEKILPDMARKFYKIPKVKELYDRRKEFDLTIINHIFNELTYPFVHEMPFITIATTDVDPRQSAVLGNVLNPAYAPNLMKDYAKPMSMLTRFMNTIEHILFAVYWRHWVVVPAIQKEISAQFPDLPPLLDIERNQSLSLMNSHFSMGVSLPLLPSQVEVGMIHCRSGKPLPEDLESFIIGAGPKGVVYFNLGSVIQGSAMPAAYRDMFLEAFRKLEQRVIWKFETELEGLPENVLLRNWMPQQDILAHPNVKVFITHGGHLSTQEAFYHGKPILVLPINGDQPRNTITIETNGLGSMLVWEELSTELIVESLRELIQNPKFRMNAESVQGPLRDQPESPKERAVFWSEYVIRHKGAPRLRSPAAQLSWVEFLMLDVLLAMHILLFVTFALLRRIARALCSKLFGAKDTQRGKKKRE